MALEQQKGKLLGCLEICHAACCRGDDMRIDISKEEYERLTEDGWKLYGCYPPCDYKRYGPCPRLDGNRCSVRNEPNRRARICSNFPFMSWECRRIRANHPDLVQVYLPGELEGNFRFNLANESKMLIAIGLRGWSFGLGGSSEEERLSRVRELEELERRWHSR